MDTDRSSKRVIEELLREMEETVFFYHPAVRRTSTAIGGLIAGTACFPGGSGLWRGEANGGPLPERFPKQPAMFVGHNFDGIAGYERSFARKGEAGQQFWKKLLVVLAGAGIAPEDCFFTNALMGLKPGSAVGKMPSVAGYRAKCLRFLKRQIEIVQPRAVIALGVEAGKLVSKLDCLSLSMRHPGDWHFRALQTGNERLLAEGRAIGEFLSRRVSAIVANSSDAPMPVPTRPNIFVGKDALDCLTSSNAASHASASGVDSWGFRRGTKQSFLIAAIEASDKTKEEIRLEYAHRFGESQEDSKRKSTFKVFFTDFIRPFGSASPSRSVRIETDSQGRLSLDRGRAALVKSAIATGLLKEIDAVEKGTFPKTDRSSVEAILDRFGIPLNY